jgi:UDP-N-acetylglucosamine 4,6-dehydratase
VVEGKSCLITGGSGFLGKRLIERLCVLGARRVIVYSRDEHKHRAIRARYDNDALRLFIGDVRDRERLRLACRDVDVLIHAAALKDVPSCEYNPTEAIETNIVGTKNVLDVAVDSSIQRAILVSSDKAVSPANLYGMTKGAAEKAWIAYNYLQGRDEPHKFWVVRYGNVMGSTGSVVGLYREMVAAGAKTLPVTDRKATRFWMHVDQAVDLILETVSVEAGTVLIPRVKSFKVWDLARNFQWGIKPEVTELRPGEKVHETMVGGHEVPRAYVMGKNIKIVPEMKFSEGTFVAGEPLTRQYDSRHNEQMSAEEIKHGIDSLIDSGR